MGTSIIFIYLELGFALLSDLRTRLVRIIFLISAFFSRVESEQCLFVTFSIQPIIRSIYLLERNSVISLDETPQYL